MRAKPNIALIGPMGVGKTSVGRLLSVALKMGFFDFDAEIEARAAMSINQIFHSLGEPHFRQLEHEICQKIPQMQGFVVSTGGGVLLNPANLPLLRSTCTIIHLSASPPALQQRLEGDQTRPLLHNLGNILSEREPLYKEAADHTIKTDKKTPTACVEEIMLYWSIRDLNS
ncbi:MAG: shikimate kinase [Defluviitaleaceae bacterium]|nr:shikimate kinase [Defluviitaleaceae bacterium]